MATKPHEPVIGDGSLHVGDRVVYPNQGICRITGVETKNIAGQNWEVVTLSREEDGATVMVPKAKVMGIGLRKVADVAAIERVFDELASPDTRSAARLEGAPPRERRPDERRRPVRHGGGAEGAARALPRAPAAGEGAGALRQRAPSAGRRDCGGDEHPPARRRGQSRLRALAAGRHDPQGEAAAARDARPARSARRRAWTTILGFDDEDLGGGATEPAVAAVAAESGRRREARTRKRRSPPRPRPRRRRLHPKEKPKPAHRRRSRRPRRRRSLRRPPRRRPRRAGKEGGPAKKPPPKPAAKKAAPAKKPAAKAKAKGKR